MHDAHDFRFADLEQQMAVGAVLKRSIKYQAPRVTHEDSMFATGGVVT